MGLLALFGTDRVGPLLAQDDFLQGAIHVHPGVLNKEEVVCEL